MNLNIDFLRTFIAVSDTKGFTNAGRLVHRSQAAVSMQIKRLEDEIGKQLFERCGKYVKLTPDGELLLNYARRIIKAHDEASVALSRPNRIETIRLGFPEHYMHGILPDLLRRFSSAYPDTRVELISQCCKIVEKWIQSGKLDIGLCAQILEGGQVLYNDPVVWISKPGFIIEKDKNLSLAVFVEGCSVRTWALDALEKAGFSYTIPYVSQSLAVSLDAVRSGLAIAPLAKSAVPQDLTIFGPDAGLPRLPVSNIAMYLSKTSPSPAISCLADYLLRSFKEKA